jgi:hypothetical protein
MEWHGEKMLPNGLPRLVYEIAPPLILKNLKVISHNRTEKNQTWVGSVVWQGGYWKVDIYPTLILFHITGNECGTLSLICWKQILNTMLHEIGHIVTLGKVSWAFDRRYEDDEQFHQDIERLAYEWRDRVMEIIASRDPRLGQPPGWIGGLPGLYLLRRANIGREDGTFDKGTCRRLKDFRAYRCGGQYGVDDVIWEAGRGCFSPVVKRRIRQRINRLAPSIGITRNYVDGAGRKHLFFNHGEAVAMSAELVKTIPKSWYAENWKRDLMVTQMASDDPPF